MSDESTLRYLGAGAANGPNARLERFHALAVAALTPRVETTEAGTARHELVTSPTMQRETLVLSGSTHTTVTELNRQQDLDQKGALVAGRLSGLAAGTAAIGDGQIQGLVAGQGSIVAGVGTQSDVVQTPSTYVAVGSAGAMVVGQLQAAAAGGLTTSQGVNASAAIGVLAQGTASANASGMVALAPGLIAAQGQALAEAAARVRAAGSANVQIGPGINASGNAMLEAEAVARAGASGGVLVSPTAVGAHGEAFAEAYVHADSEVGAAIDIGHQALTAQAALRSQVATGAKARAGGLVQVGVDSFGLPSFGVGANVEAASGAWARSQARGAVSILGLIRVGASGSAEAMAGLGGGLNGQLSYADGMVTVGAGASAAAGVGGGAGATVSVGLGKLPGGVLQAVGSPILPLPGLIGTTIVRGFRALVGAEDEDPTHGKPGLEDFPRIVGANFTNGVKLIGEGAVEAGEQLLSVGKAVVDGATAVGSVVVDGVVALGKGIGTGAAAVGGAVADGAVFVAKNVAKGAEAVADGIGSVFSSIGKGIASLFGG